MRSEADAKKSSHPGIFWRWLDFLLFVCGGRASKTFHLQTNEEYSLGKKELIHGLPCVFILGV